MAIYVAFIVPESWFLARFGLRITLIVGAVLNAVGALIKLGSASPNLFWVSMLGQVCCAFGKVKAQPSWSFLFSTKKSLSTFEWLDR